MALLRVYENIFENKFIEKGYDNNKSLLNQIEELNTKEYEKTLIECYDSETGETYYEPMIDNSSDQCVVILVNKEEVSLDVEIKENDIIEVVFLPLSSREGAIWGGIGLGNIAGSIIGGLIGFAVGTLVPGIGNVVGLIVGAAIGGTIGAIAGGFVGADLWDKAHAKQQSLGEGESLPDVRGASNQPLVNNPYPFVIGKHLITPYIVGSPYVEYTGERGENAYIHVLYHAGYAPLKLTEFKMGDMTLAHNQEFKTKQPTLLYGLLKGCNDDDSGDILSIWKNNEVEIEILQQHSLNPIGRGNIYPNVVKDLEVNSSLMFVADGSLTKQTSIVYKGGTYPNNFKSNTVKLTERCPKKFKIVLDIPNGLYSSHTKSDDDGNSKQIYESIPLWLCVQYRVINRNNASSVTDGSDYSQWKNITTFNGKNISKTYTSALAKKDIIGHLGNSFNNECTVEKKLDYVSDEVEFFENYYKSFNKETSTKTCIKYRAGFDAFAKAGRIMLSTDFSIYSLLHTAYIDDFQNYLIAYRESDRALVFGTEDIVYGDVLEEHKLPRTINIKVYRTISAGVTTLYVNKILVPGKHRQYINVYTYKISQQWVDKELVNLQELTVGLSNEDLASEIRAVAEINLSEDEIKEVMDSVKCPQQAVEVRVLRVTPNYLNQTSSNGKHTGAYSYSDQVKWVLLQTETFDEEKYIENGQIINQYAISDYDLNNHCYVSLKVKADTAGNIDSSLDKFNCIAEAFAPYWDNNAKKWFPENVHKKVKYYGYYADSALSVMTDRSSDSYEVSVTKSQYEYARQHGYNWIESRDGSSFTEEVINSCLNPTVIQSGSKYISQVNGSIVETTGLEVVNDTLTHNGVICAVETDYTKAFNYAGVSSGFMLGIVGGQNGIYALGYEDVNLLSVADLAEFEKDVTDGSTYSRDTYVDGMLKRAGTKIHMKFEANAYVYQQQKMETLLSKIAICGRSVFTYDDLGKIKIIIDKPVNYPKGIISQQNCISSDFTFLYDDDVAGYQINYPDEDDFYENHNFYCWSDGNSIKNYKGTVPSLEIPFITNCYQAWSIGRYVLACSVMQKQGIRVKIGMEGFTFELGDVIVYQSEELLIGKDSGRVQEILLDNDGNAIGFVMDNIYEYTGEYDEKGKIAQGVMLLQPKQNGRSRTITLRLSEPKSITINDTVYAMTKGTTNVVLFDKPYYLDTNYKDTSGSKVCFDTGDIVLIGDYSNIGEKYRITSIKPESNKTNTITLAPYTDEMYQYGRKIPVFHPNIRKQPVVKDFIQMSEVPVNIKELNQLNRDISENAARTSIKKLTVVPNILFIENQNYKDRFILIKISANTKYGTESFAGYLKIKEYLNEKVNYEYTTSEKVSEYRHYLTGVTDKIEVELYGTSKMDVILDSEEIDITSSLDGISVILDNDSIHIPATSEGEVLNEVTEYCNINVYVGFKKANFYVSPEFNINIEGLDVSVDGNTLKIITRTGIQLKDVTKINIPIIVSSDGKFGVGQGDYSIGKDTLAIGQYLKGSTAEIIKTINVVKQKDGKQGVKGEQGIQGIQGPKGADGTSVKILGTKESTSELPNFNNNVGDGYLIDGYLWVWAESEEWTNVGRIKGEDGTSFIIIETELQSYTTQTQNGFLPSYRVTKDKVLSEGNVSKVSIGDVIAYSYYLFSVGYVDSEYCYLGKETIIKGDDGVSPIISTSKDGDTTVITINDINGTNTVTIKDGADGKPLNNRGNYSSSSSYKINDYVYYADTKTSYVCKKDADIGIKPTNVTYWSVLATSGKDGANATQYYTHFVYVDDIVLGTNYSTTESRKYLGIYTDTSEKDAETFELAQEKDPIWNKIQGENGAAVKKVTEYYLVSSKKTGITKDDSGWTVTPPELTDILKYLWNYTFTEYTNGSCYESNPSVIGVYGESAIVYSIKTDYNSIIKFPDGSYNHDTVNIRVYKHNKGIQSSYNGILVITETDEFGMDSVKYISSLPESVRTYTPSKSLSNINIKVYNSLAQQDSSGNYDDADLLDEENIDVIESDSSFSVEVDNDIIIVNVDSKENSISSSVERCEIKVHKGFYDYTNFEIVPSFKTSYNGFSISFEKSIAVINITNGRFMKDRENLVIPIRVFTDKKSLCIGKSDYAIGKGTTGIKVENYSTFKILNARITLVKNVKPSGIMEVGEYYARTKDKEKPSIQSFTKGTPPEYDGVNKYLWNYSIIQLEDGSLMSSDIILLSVSEKGIKSVTEYYLVSRSSSGITIDTPGWSTTATVTTAIDKYLWNYEETVYTDGSKDVISPHIIGVYGDTGAKGEAGQKAPVRVGVYSSAPSTRGDRTSLVTGDTYLNNTNGYLYVYNGSSWSAISDTTDSRYFEYLGDMMKDIENNGTAFTKTATAWVTTLFAGNIFAEQIFVKGKISVKNIEFQDVGSGDVQLGTIYYLDGGGSYTARHFKAKYKGYYRLLIVPYNLDNETTAFTVYRNSTVIYTTQNNNQYTMDIYMKSGDILQALGSGGRVSGSGYVHISTDMSNNSYMWIESQENFIDG